MLHCGLRPLNYLCELLAPPVYSTLPPVCHVPYATCRMQVRVTSQRRRTAAVIAREAATGVTQPVNMVYGTFYPEPYLEGRECIEYDGEMVTRGRWVAPLSCRVGRPWGQVGKQYFRRARVWAWVGMAGGPGCGHMHSPRTVHQRPGNLHGVPATAYRFVHNASVFRCSNSMQCGESFCVLRLQLRGAAFNCQLHGQC